MGLSVSRASPCRHTNFALEPLKAAGPITGRVSEDIDDISHRSPVQLLRVLRRKPLVH